MELVRLSQQLADVAATVAHGVVRIEPGTRSGATGVVWSPDAILCADHALERDVPLRVVLADGTRLDAALAGREPALDLALVRVAAANLVAPAWVDLDAVRPGELVLALSRGASALRVGLGIVSVVGAVWRTWMGARVERLLQVDARLHSGLSGSLVVDAQGRPLGMATARLRRGTAVVLPRATLARVAERLLAGGGARRGFLGVGAMPVRLPDAVATRTAAEKALLVVSVQPGSPADAAGIVLGDVIVALGARLVGSLPELLDALEDATAGERRSLRLLRGGEPRDVTVTLGARAA